MSNAYREITRGRQRLDRTTYTGIVISNNDPERLQRIKVRISDIHRNIEDADLPWVSRDTDAGSAGGVGQVQVPPVGAEVSVSFRSNDPYHGFYSGGRPTGPAAADLPDYPHSYGMTDHAGNQWYINTRDGGTEMKVTHVSGSTVSIDKDGNILFKSVKNVVIEAQEDVTINAKKKFTVTSQENIEMNTAQTAVMVGQTGAQVLSPQGVTLAGGAFTRFNSGGGLEMNLQGDFNVRTGGSGAIQTSGPLALRSGGGASLEGSGLVTIAGGGITLNHQVPGFIGPATGPGPTAPDGPGAPPPAPPTTGAAAPLPPARTRPTLSAPQNQTDY